nr:multisubstrate pseudouridine synthase 7 isoform X2 [Ipomoea batatas]
MLKVLCRRLTRIQQIVKPCKRNRLSALKPYNYPSPPAAFSAEVMNPMDESDVGISCYISHLPGFRGILKQRYSDFIVNEVDLDGNVVHLTSLDAPLEILEEKEVKVTDQPDKSYATEVESFRSLAGDSDADKLKNFIDKISSGVDVSDEYIILSPSSNKSHRTEIHNFFKERLKLLVTDTVDGPEDSSKCVRVRLNVGGNSGRGRNSRKRKERGDKPYDSRGSDHWPQDLGKFLRFHLYKENKDTQEALGLIAKMLGVQVTVFKQRANKLAALNERLIGIKVGDFCHVNEGLQLGQLFGNQFTITLRGVVAESDDIIKASVISLGKNGFINYFGLQKNPISRVREYYKESGDIDGTLWQLPRHLVAERAILQCLKKNQQNYLHALKGIPRTLRMMYVHSYQSYLWNHAASFRVQKHGFDQVVVGDLVYCKEPCTEKETYLECEDGSGNDTNDSINPDEISETDVPEERNISVKAVNEEDIRSGTYTIDDVVLPLPGSRVIYPSNDIAKIYHDLAEKDGVKLTESMHNVKEFSITNMTGSYRRVFQKPKDFEWELIAYSDGTQSLAETDWEIISKSVTSSQVRDSGSAKIKDDELPIGIRTESKNIEAENNNDQELGPEPECMDEIKIKTVSQPEECLDGSSAQENQMALKMTFTLPASCYATMAVRELLKTSTSVIKVLYLYFPRYTLSERTNTWKRCDNKDGLSLRANGSDVS